MITREQQKYLLQRYEKAANGFLNIVDKKFSNVSDPPVVSRARKLVKQWDKRQEKNRLRDRKFVLKQAVKVREIIMMSSEPSEALSVLMKFEQG